MTVALTGAVCAVLLGAPALQAQTATDTLEAGFANPPDSAKPRVWWHWMSGNVTQEGITADLEWMKRVNIGGMQMFDGDLGVPVFVDKPLTWMTPEWKAAWRHAAAEADRLHLEMAMAASGGWSETAGPWVKPEQGMKKYVWSETAVKGPKHFSGALAAPPQTVGKFQQMPEPPPLNLPSPKGMPGAKPQPPTPPRPATPEVYRDVAVVAYRVPESEASAGKPEITSSGGAIDGDALTDGDFHTSATLKMQPGDESGWVEFAYAQPIHVYAVTLGAGSIMQFSGAPLPEGRIESSDDGQSWKTLLDMPAEVRPGSANFPVRTWTVPETTARYFRVVVKPKTPNPMMAALGFAQSSDLVLTEVAFHTSSRVNDWEDKASFGTYIDRAGLETPSSASSHAIATRDVIDLTGKMRPDGTLDWQAPEGNWMILRLGYSLTGEINHPATPAATGLEVDKLSHEDVTNYVETYTKMISDVAGPYFGKSFQYFLMDSWEAGQENWTETMMAEFHKHAGYDMTPYLPVLTGRVVGSAAASDAFLWDFRRTIADLLAENHYAVATDYFKKHGVGLYAEAMGADLPTTGDGLLNKGQVTIPMAEFWTPLPDHPDTPEHPADVREASSASHIYGKPLTATESFTTMPTVIAWGQSPFYLKPLADEHFAAGVNRIVFHTSDQQPFVDDKHRPGITLGFFGQHYTRNITWAEQAKAWNTYLARCSYLLQQGKYVADVAYFYGEGAPVTVPFWKKLNPAAPTHYSYDFINRDVLMKATVREGRIVLPSGMSYRLLVVPEDVRAMSLPLLRKMDELVSAGAVLLAPRPAASPTLSDGARADAEVQRLAERMWGRDGSAGAGQSVGKGHVYTGMPIEAVLTAEKVAPDVEYSTPTNVGADVHAPLPKGDTDDDITWIHRALPDGDIYFVSTQKPHAFDTEVTFRVAGRAAELWYPDRGMSRVADYSMREGRTVVPIHFDPEGSVFVVFRKSAAGPSRKGKQADDRELVTIDGSWQITFPPNLGAPAKIEMNPLASWTENADSGVKYFSGTATYEKTIDAPKEWFAKGARLEMDLGAVREIAEVSVNGRSIGGVQWKPPYRVDLTDALKPGENRIAIKVTNLWPNRMIGDLQPGVEKTYTFTDFRPFKADSPLLESGLLGPVKLLRVAEEPGEIVAAKN